MTHFFVKVFLFICLSLLNITVNAQLKDSLKNTFVPFDTIKVKLEARHHVKFFYDPIWFEGKEFSASIAKMPLPEAISVITKISQLSVSKIKESYFVFLPENQINSSSNDNNNILEIGDILDYGSKSHAKVDVFIVNGSNTNPLIGAKIEVTDIKQKCQTNNRGVVSMIIPVGEHELKVEYPGYDTKSLRAKVYSDGNITVEMYIKTILLDEVSVVATKIDQFYRRTKMSVMSIDAKTIKELPTNLGETDIIKGLSLLPGVQTTGEFGSGFNVRGGGSDQNLVLIEDVPIFNTSHLFGLTSIINPDGISKVTLYKGGIPVTYGERASSILSVKMGTEDINHFKVKGGIGLINSRITLEIPIKDKLKIILGGRASYSDWLLKRLPDLELKNSSASFNDVNLYASYNISSRDELTLFAYSSNDKFKFSEINRYNYSNILGSINYSHRFNSSLFTNFVVGTSHFNAGFIQNDTLMPLESYQLSNAILYNNLKWNLVYKLNDAHILSMGINGFLYNVEPGKVMPYGELSNVFTQGVQKEKGFEWAGFIGDDYEINNKIGVEFGIRLSNFYYLGAKKVYFYTPGVLKSAESISDSVSYKNNEIIKAYWGLEPRLTFRYNIDYYSSIRLSYNRINQYVNLMSNTAVASPTDLWKLSDTYLKPLISDQIAIGYFKNFKSDYETSVELYYKPYQNVIEYKNGAQIFLNNYLETDLIKAKGKSFGIEFYVKKNSGKLNGWVSYTLSKSIRKTTSSNPLEQLNENSWFPDNLDKPNNLVINGSYYLNRRWKLGLTFNYSTGRPVTIPELKYTIKGSQIVYYSDRNKYRMPDYHRLDMSISQFESLKINKKWKGYWTISLINVYGRKNAYSIFYKRDHSPYNYDPRSNLFKLYIIGRPLPTFSYTFVF